jgi:hypothetical protein
VESGRARSGATAALRNGYDKARMIGDYLSLALRNVARTKLYAAISVTGLAIGFAAVLVHTWGMAGKRPVAALRYE